MKKPAELVRLIEALDERFDQDAEMVEAISSAGMTVLFETGAQLELDSYDLERLLQSEETVKRFFEAIGSPDGASVEIQGAKIPAQVFDTLSELFVDVNEI